MLLALAIAFPNCTAAKAALLVLLAAAAVPKEMVPYYIPERTMALPRLPPPLRRMILCALTASCNMVRSW